MKNTDEVSVPNQLAQGLSLSDLKHLIPGIFDQGEIANADLPVPMVSVKENPGRRFKWCAVRGKIHDWAIYLLDDNYTYEQCRAIGQKTSSKDNITFLVPCTPEALEMYRY